MNIKNPTVDVTGVKLTGLSFENADLLFDIRIQNPNALGIHLAGFDYTLQINNNDFLQGKQQKAIDIPSRRQNTVQLPLSLTFMDLFQTIKNLMHEDSLQYQLSTKFYFDLPLLGQIDIPVEHTGKLPVLKLPILSVKSLKLDKISLSGADLSLHITLKNRNAFHVDVNRLKYIFDVDGVEWISGTSDRPLIIPERGENTSDIKMHLNIMEMGRSIYRNIQGEAPLNYSFRGTLDFSTPVALINDVDLPFEKSGKISISR